LHATQTRCWFLALAGRRQSGLATKLVDARNRIAAVLKEIDILTGGK
jgi:hypothetical protein